MVQILFIQTVRVQILDPVSEGPAVSSHSSHHPQEVLLAQFNLNVHKGGIKPHKRAVSGNSTSLLTDARLFLTLKRSVESFNFSPT